MGRNKNQLKKQLMISILLISLFFGTIQVLAETNKSEKEIKWNESLGGSSVSANLNLAVTSKIEVEPEFGIKPGDEITLTSELSTEDVTSQVELDVDISFSGTGISGTYSFNVPALGSTDVAVPGASVNLLFTSAQLYFHFDASIAQDVSTESGSGTFTGSSYSTFNSQTDTGEYSYLVDRSLADDAKFESHIRHVMSISEIGVFVETDDGNRIFNQGMSVPESTYESSTDQILSIELNKSNSTQLIIIIALVVIAIGAAIYFIRGKSDPDQPETSETGTKGSSIITTTRSNRKPCPTCGYMNPEKNNFCFECGTDFSDVSKDRTDSINVHTIDCPSCATAIRSDLKFCTNCGFALKSQPQKSQEISSKTPTNSEMANLTCNVCGTLNVSTRKFCSECGSKLD